MAVDKKLSELTTDNILKAGVRFYTVDGAISGFSEYDQLCELIAFDGLLSFGFEDLRVPLTATKAAGIKDPTFAKFGDNGAGSSGVFVWGFPTGIERELFFSVQIPHGWKEGTDIYPHIHWATTVNGGAGQKVSWGLEYQWADMYTIFGNTNLIYANTAIPDEQIVKDKHYFTEFAAISGSGKTASSMLNCRLFRDGISAGLTDDFGDTAFMFEFDFHYEVYRFGTETRNPIL